MEQLRNFYNPTAVLPPPPREPVHPDERVYGGHLFWPQVNHNSIGYYPFFTPLKRTALHLDDDHNIIFQHAPQFAYNPGHSNVDVILSPD